ncbi:MAG TPA: RNA-directed DNA polymerase, partial [bacterium]|nr:RNA-directed DNA polymerase [bacterium]
MVIMARKLHSQPASQPASQIGIPIGNLTSQFFANIYLNRLDYFVKEKLGCKHYIRYQDDFVLFSNDKSLLSIWLQKIRIFLDTNLALSLHENKCKIFSVETEVPFLGFVFCGKRVRIKRASIVRFKRRMKYFSKGLLQRTVRWKTVDQSVMSWIGHVKHADTYNLRKLVLGDIVLQGQGEEGAIV